MLLGSFVEDYDHEDEDVGEEEDVDLVNLDSQLASPSASVATKERGFAPSQFAVWCPCPAVPASNVDVLSRGSYTAGAAASAGDLRPELMRQRWLIRQVMESTQIRCFR